MKKLALVAVLATLAVAGAAMAIGSGGGSSAPIKASASAEWQGMPTHRVAAPSTAGKAAAGKVHRAKVAYFETDVFNLAAGDVDGTTGKCPKRFKAINGYFGDNTSAVVPIFNSSGNTTRKWTIGVLNVADSHAAKVFLGFVCLQP